MKRHTNLKLRIDTDVALALLMNKSWIEARVPELALENTSYALVNWSSQSWYRVGIDPNGPAYFDVKPFEPPRNRSLYSRGSSSSILLERAMFIRVQTEPMRTSTQRDGVNRNGTWSGWVHRSEGPLVINLTDQNSDGQDVRLNASWVLSYGIGRPSFVLSGGEPLQFEKDENEFVIHPPHFSFLYVFSGDEHFRKETDFPNSEVYLVPSFVALSSDRTDPGDEWFSRPLPQEIDSTTSFTVSSQWIATTQGNYQFAMPLFLVSARDTDNYQPSGLYFEYYSRNGVSTPPCADCSPLYYLLYYDRNGVARIHDTSFEGVPNVRYRFLATYTATTRILTMQIKNFGGGVLRSISYTIGTNSGDDFVFGKVGLGSAHQPGVGPEQPASGEVDEIELTLGLVVNPSVELDANEDGLPDGWHTAYYFASRSPDYRHSGAWSIKIDDQSAYDGGGMETDDTPAIPGKYYRALAYANVYTGSFQLSLTFSSASHVVLSTVTMTIGTTNSYWRRIYVDGVAPPNSVYARVMAWSLTTNIGRAYFDSFYLVDSRLMNAGFEDGAGTVPSHWSGIGGAIPTVDRVHVRAGVFSLRLNDVSSGSSPGVRSEWDYGCLPGLRYRVAGWVFVESATPGGSDTPYTLSLVFWAGSESTFGVDGGGVGSWDYLAVEAVAPAFCSLAAVEFKSSQGNIGAANLDDVEFLLAPPGLEIDSSMWTSALWGTPGFPDSLGPGNDLGTGHERRDFAWNQIEVIQAGTYNWSYVGQRPGSMRAASQVGIDYLPIVGGSLGTYTPSWVTASNFAQMWNSFCARFGREFGGLVHWYQLANEENHFVHGNKLVADTTVFNQCFAGLLSSDSATNPDHHTLFFRTIVNSYGVDSVALMSWLAGAGSAIDVIAADFYPGSWGSPDQDWSALSGLESIGQLYNKPIAIMETGKGVGAGCTEQCQSTWVTNNLPLLRSRVVTQNIDDHNSRYVLLAWFLQQDGCDDQACWGLVRVDGSHKPSYATFRAETLLYVGPPFYS